MSTPPTATPLPAETQLQLRMTEATRLWRREEAGAFLLRAMGAGSLLCGLMLAADVLLHLPAGARAALAVAGVLSGAGALAMAGWLRWRRPVPEERIARLMESRDPALGSRLMNFLQLRSTAAVAEHPVTRSLAARAVAEAAEGVAAHRLLPLVKRQDQARLLLVAGVPAALLLAAGMVFHGPVLAALVRYLDPWGDHPAWSVTQLHFERPAAAGSEVMHGQSAPLEVTWRGHEPSEVLVSVVPAAQPDAEPLLVPLFAAGDGRAFHGTLENVTADLVVRARTRNGWSQSEARRITVILTPQFGPAWLAMAPPAYTGIAPDRRDFAFGAVKALKGSVLTFTLRSNRPLRGGKVKLRPAAEGVPAEEHDLVPGERPDEVSGSFTATTGGRLTFHLEDITGVPSDADRACSLTVTHDTGAQVAVTEPATDGFLVEGTDFRPRAEATDDYGVSLIRLHLGVNGKHGEPVTGRAEGKGVRKLSQDAALPAGLKPGDVLTIHAEAIDTAPEPRMARSEVRELTVISREEHLELLRREHVIGELESKYRAVQEQHRRHLREQKALAEAAAAAEQRAAQPDAQEAEAGRRELEALRRRQEELNRELLADADAMEAFAAQPDIYDIEASFREQLAAEAQAVRESVARNGQDMAAAAPLASSAAAHHERMAGKEAATSENIAKALEDASLMQALVNDYNHFRELHARQEALTKQAEAYRERATPTAEDRMALRELGAEQRAVAQELQELVEKLRQDAEAAQQTYPKAAGQAAGLAMMMEDARLDSLALQASAQMQRGNGKGSWDGAERLRGTMEKFFSECSGQLGAMGEEMGLCLSKQGMKPGNSFSQMMQSRRFGSGSQGTGSSGQGQGGTMAQGQVAGGRSVIGGQRLGGPGDGRPQPAASASAPAAAGETAVADAAPDTDSAPAAVRESEAVSPGVLLEQYRALTDAYFDRITAPTAPNSP